MTEIFVRRHFLEIVTFYKTRLTYQKFGFATTQNARIQTAPTDGVHKKAETFSVQQTLFRTYRPAQNSPLGKGYRLTYHSAKKTTSMQQSQVQSPKLHKNPDKSRP
jgi:hypothetical protein